MNMDVQDSKVNTMFLFFVLWILIINLILKPHECSDNWLKDRRTGKQYLVLHTYDLVYDELQQECHNHGGFLPEPKNPREAMFLLTLKADRRQLFTLGMTDRHHEGVWAWESDCSPVRWTKWMAGGSYSEPNGGVRENCALMQRDYWKNTYFWMDYACESNAHIRHTQFKILICENIVINHCPTDNPCVNGRCVNTNNCSYHCDCANTRYTGPYCQFVIISPTQGNSSTQDSSSTIQKARLVNSTTVAKRNKFITGAEEPTIWVHIAAFIAGLFTTLAVIIYVTVCKKNSGCCRRNKWCKCMFRRPEEQSTQLDFEGHPTWKEDSSQVGRIIHEDITDQNYLIKISRDTLVHTDKLKDEPSCSTTHQGLVSTSTTNHMNAASCLLSANDTALKAPSLLAAATHHMLIEKPSK